jgi:dihydroorotate dehydrogenase (fumarate)/dihydroorotate dehydrogenase
VPLYTDAIRPFLFRCDPEWVHDRSLQVGSWVGNIGPLREALAAFHHFEDDRLRTEVGGVGFPNPVGLAAGYDKNGRVIPLMEALGFGFVEIGSVSADRSVGNPRPRLWRLPEDRGICVHYGLPNDGAEAIAARLARTRRTVPLAINVVKTNRGIDAPPDPDDVIIEDYLRSIRLLKGQADMLCLNLSCPNTEMGRDFFCEPANIGRLVSALAGVEVGCPVFLKVPPLSGSEAADRFLEAVADSPVIAGFVFNLPPGLPDGLRTPAGRLAAIRGAVSGKPVEDRINASIRALYRRMDRRRYQIIGVGGIFSAEDAYAKIRLGASLVQLLTGLIYEGPGLIARIKQGLCRLLERDGFSSIGEAVGTAEPG